MLLEYESSAKVLHQSSSLLACKGIAFNLFWNQSFFANTLQLPAICVLHPALKIFCSNTRALLARTFQGSSTCFWEARFATAPIVLAVTIHTLPWKMRLEKCPFSLFSMASFLVLFVFGHAVETSHLGDVSAQELCQASGDFSLEQVGIDVSAPCMHESNSLDVNMTKYARSSGRVVQELTVELTGK